MRRYLPLLAVVLGALLLSACGRNMNDQPRFEVYEASPFFEDGASARPLVDGTVSRERGAYAPGFFDGTVAEFPLEVDLDLLQRGQERYNIYCAPCHGFVGAGDGIVVQKGFPRPVSFHDERLLNSPNSWYFNAITNGFGRMYPYAARVSPEDRWAITAYIRALQLSQAGAPIASGDASDDVSDSAQGAIRP